MSVAAGPETMTSPGRLLPAVLALLAALHLAAPGRADGGEAGHAVVLKTGERIPCTEAPVIAFGRVAYQTADGVRHSLSLSVVDVEATRAASPARPRPSSASPGRRLAPDFEATAADGSTVRLSELRGTVVLVDFWATWCGPCVREIPTVKALYEELAGEDFEILGVSLDRSRADFEAFVSSRGLAWPQHFSGAGWSDPVARAYGVRSIPRAMLVDREGRIVRDHLRGPSLRSAARSVLEEGGASRGGNAPAR